MKEAYWGYWLVVLGVFIIVVLLLVQSFTSSNTQDYYLVKTITEAAMEDAIDYAYYRQYGEIRINKERFYASFLRRFAEEASISTTYDIEFNEVYEAPPKVGVKVSSQSNTFSVVGDAESFDIVNRIDAILESKITAVKSNSTTTKQYAVDVSAHLGSIGTDDGTKAGLNNCKIKFTLGACSTADKVDLTVVKCGLPSSDGVITNNMDEHTSYCIAHKTGDATCTVIATYDQFQSGYCS
ncbi:MAG: hypothetical protein E7164_04020 [Firmicutes bacterium]|nr:hypothetical protein [Bacillota bacterium]